MNWDEWNKKFEDKISTETFFYMADPRESLMTQGNSLGQIFQTIPEDFPLFFRLLD